MGEWGGGRGGGGQSVQPTEHDPVCLCGPCAIANFKVQLGWGSHLHEVKLHHPYIYIYIYSSFDILCLYMQNHSSCAVASGIYVGMSLGLLSLTLRTPSLVGF